MLGSAGSSLSEGCGGEEWTILRTRWAVAWVTDVHGSSVCSEGFLVDGVTVLVSCSMVIEV